jgi:hypothetical protein
MFLSSDEKTTSPWVVGQEVLLRPRKISRPDKNTPKPPRAAIKAKTHTLPADPDEELQPARNSIAANMLIFFHRMLIASLLSFINLLSSGFEPAP